MNQVSLPVTTSDPVEAVRQWFALMGRYCASEDYDGAWLAVHTHFSLYPGTPQRTYGARA